MVTNPRLAVLSGNAGVVNLDNSVNIRLTNPSDTGTALSLEQVSATIGLKITPTVLPSQVIKLVVDAQVTTFTSLGGSTMPSTATQSVTTTVKVRNNQTIILGGLLQKQTLDRVTGVPGLSKIPLLGALFRKQTKSVNYDETAIYITPRLEPPSDGALDDELDALVAHAAEEMTAGFQEELATAEELKKERKKARKELRKLRRGLEDPP